MNGMNIGKNRTIINSLYSLIAIFYRVIIIKPTLNFLFKNILSKIAPCYMQVVEEGKLIPIFQKKCKFD